MGSGRELGLAVGRRVRILVESVGLVLRLGGAAGSLAEPLSEVSEGGVGSRDPRALDGLAVGWGFSLEAFSASPTLDGAL